MSDGYMVVISLGVAQEYQPYRGWDQVFEKRENADALCEKANAKFPGAKVIPAAHGDYFLIENSGNQERQVFGPYLSVPAAQKEAGKRYMVISGPHLENGQKMWRNQLKTQILMGNIRIEDGSSIDSL